MNIPLNVVNAVRDNTTDRVILLVMSTLPPRLSVTTYQYCGENDSLAIEPKNAAYAKNYTFKGISQLEAGTKYYLQKLAGKGVKVNRIVIIASDATIANQNVTVSQGETRDVEAVSVYSSRIRSFMTGTQPETNGTVDAKAGDIPESAFIGQGLYSADDLNSLFHVVNEKDSLRRLWETAREIRGNGAEKSVNLYIDMQGGSRNDLPMMNAVLELLKDRNVKVCERTATGFNAANRIQPLKTVDKLYRSYDLVSAYEIFKLYGWGDQLADYFKNRNKPNDPQDLRIVNAITKISDAIKLCDVAGFDDGLRQLNAGIRDFKRSREDTEITEMNFLVDQIQNDFGELLDGRSANELPAPMHYVKQIRWCLRKNFIQQAITIVESKMPREFVQNGLYYYCGHADRQAVLNKFIDIFDWYTKEEQTNCRQPSTKYRMLDIDHYWLKDYTKDKGKNGFPVTINPHWGIQDHSQVNNLISQYKNLSNKRNQVNHAASQDHQPDGFYETEKKRYPKDRVFHQNQTGDALLAKEIKNFLDKFDNLASQVPAKVKEDVVDLY